MIFALAVILGTITLGTVLAFLPGLGPRALGVVRAFALGAAVAVVLLHLLPDALAVVGPRAFLALLIGVLLPLGIERLFDRRSTARTVELAFEVGFVGLLAHSFADGLALWAVAGNSAAILALGAHVVPVTTVVVLREVEHRGWGRALARAAALAGATVAGLLAGEAVAVESIASIQPWITAVASGLLLHVVAHEVAGPPPARVLERTLELAAVVVGVALSLGGALAHGDLHEDTFLEAYAHALVAGARVVALPVALALLLSMLLEHKLRLPDAGRPQLRRAVAWIAVGWVVGAFLDATLAREALEPLAWVVALATLVGLAWGHPLAAAVLAVALAARGAPAWALALLLLGPLMTARARRVGLGKLSVWLELAGVALAVVLAPVLGGPGLADGLALVWAGAMGGCLWWAGIRSWIGELGVRAHTR